MLLTGSYLNLKGGLRSCSSTLQHVSEHLLSKSSKAERPYRSILFRVAEPHKDRAMEDLEDLIPKPRFVGVNLNSQMLALLLSRSSFFLPK